MLRLIEELQIKVKIFDKDMDNIPEEGPFIVLVNRFSHYFEVQVVIELLKEKRPDIKVISFNPKVKGNKNAIYIRDYVGPWNKVRKKIIEEIRTANKNDYPIVVFPGRRISKISFDKFGWDREIMKAVYLSKLPVIPLYGNWQKKLTTPLGFLIPEIYFEKVMNQELTVRIGVPVNENQLLDITSLELYRKYMYMKTFSIGKNLEVDSFFSKSILQKSEVVFPKIKKEILVKEINLLPKESLIVSIGDIKVYMASSLLLSKILTQIGILRETISRDSGEGTGKEMDIDEFDVFYYQIVIWHEKKQEIIGGCRLAFVDWVIQYYGKKGLFSNSQFQFDNKMNNVLNESIEIGKIFIVKEYQKSNSVLLTLWKSLFEIAEKNPNYKYFIGSMCVSKSESKYSKKWMIYSLKKYFFDAINCQNVTPRIPFDYKLTKEDKEALIDFKECDDAQILNNLMEELNPSQIKVPPVVTQYLQQNAKFLGFTIDQADPNFLNGLLLLPVKEFVPTQKKLKQ